LVVVAIIALLISILIPSLSQARDQARSAKCLANMRDMATGVNTFAATHKNRFQLVTGGGGPGGGPQPGPYASSGPLADPDRSRYAYEPLLPAKQGRALMVWPLVLLREAGNRELKRNSDWGEDGLAAATANKTQLYDGEVLRCPADEAEIASPVYPRSPSNDLYYGFLSYAINEDIVGDRTDQANLPPVWKEGIRGMEPGAGERLQGNIDRVVRPQEVLLFVDSGADAAESGEAAAENLVLSGGGNPNDPNNYGPPRGPLLEHFERAYGRLPFDRHRRGSLNVTYADGHGSFVKRTTNTVSDPLLPNYSYLPRTRISPYNSGQFPDLSN
jgi:prepilin-type processing-associated H-X9-DG protein